MNRAPEVWLINGPFGVGKTTLAEGLCAAKPELLFFDPEAVGLMLRPFLMGPQGVDPVEDFQDLKIWPGALLTTLKHLLHYGRTLVLPISLPRPDVFEQVLAGLLSFSEITRVQHLCLIAEPETVEARLDTREGPDGGLWARAQLPRCLAAYAHPRYAHTLDTTGYLPAALLHEVLAGFERGAYVRRSAV